MDQSAAKDSIAVSHAAVAATAWLVWDTIIHLDIEVEYLWRRSNASWMKLAYVFVRYITILHEGAVLTLDVSSVRFPGSACRGWLAEEGVFMELLSLVVEIVLVMRIYVLFNHNRFVLWALSGLFAAEISVMAASIGVTVAGATFNANCQILHTPAFFTAYWVSSLAFETLLFVLTLVAFFRHVKSVYRRHSILVVFVRDGTWAYALIFVSLLLNTLMYKLIENPLAGMGYYWDVSVLSFAGSHILLNIRRLGAVEHEGAVGTTLPTMQFSCCTDPTSTTFSGATPPTESSLSTSGPSSYNQQLSTIVLDQQYSSSADSYTIEEIKRDAV